MLKQQESSLEIVNLLCEKFGEHSVFYPGLGAHKDLHSSQSSGTGSVISFATGDGNFTISLLENLKLFKTQVSFGSITSSIEIPWYHSHASAPKNMKSKLPFQDDLIRISVGIEDVKDLKHDLTNSIFKAQNLHPQISRSHSMQFHHPRRSYSSSGRKLQGCGDSTISVQGGELGSSSRFSDTLTTPIALTSAFWFENSQV